MLIILTFDHLDKLRETGVLFDNSLINILSARSSWSQAGESLKVRLIFPFNTPNSQLAEEFFGNLVGHQIDIQKLCEFLNRRGISYGNFEKIKSVFNNVNKVDTNQTMSFLFEYAISFGQLSSDFLYRFIEVTKRNLENLMEREFGSCCEILTIATDHFKIRTNMKQNPFKKVDVWKDIFRSLGLSDQIIDEIKVVTIDDENLKQNITLEFYTSDNNVVNFALNYSISSGLFGQTFKAVFGNEALEPQVNNNYDKIILRILTVDKDLTNLSLWQNFFAKIGITTQINRIKK